MQARQYKFQTMRWQGQRCMRMMEQEFGWSGMVVYPHYRLTRFPYKTQDGARIWLERNGYEIVSQLSKRGGAEGVGGGVGCVWESVERGPRVTEHRKCMSLKNDIDQKIDCD